jgi:hypothetical protein
MLPVLLIVLLVLPPTIRSQPRPAPSNPATSKHQQHAIGTMGASMLTTTPYRPRLETYTDQGFGSTGDRHSRHISQVSSVASRPDNRKPQHAYAAACAIMRNEHCNVLEWVEYHLYIGIGKIYIFDHGSTPSLTTAIADYLAAGTVELVHFSNSWQASPLPSATCSTNFPPQS